MFVLDDFKEVLIEVRDSRLRTALIINGRLVELNVEDDQNPSLLENIYVGRVEKVMDSLNACFVDLGLHQLGFLALPEILPTRDGLSFGDTVSEYLCEGDKVCVQVLRDAFEDKGPKLTTRLRLVSRSVIFMPGETDIKISHRISKSETRSHLKKLLRNLAYCEEGFIARTAAEMATNEEITANIADLRKTYQSIRDGLNKSTTPTLLHGLVDSVLRTLRYRVPGDVSKIVIDDIEAYLKVKRFLKKESPDLMRRLIYHKGPQPLFLMEKLADDIDEGLASSIMMPSGGSVIITETPALVAIDVNVAGTLKGKHERSVLETNLEACAEIARQIRLRNLGGLLVVDFVSMKQQNNKKKVLMALRRLVVEDPEQVFVAGFTRFGLVEMTRKRGKPSLRASIGQKCFACEGSGIALTVRTHGFNALDRLRVEGLSCQHQSLELRVSEALAECFEGQLKAALDDLQAELGTKVKMSIDTTLKEECFDIVPIAANKGDTHD